MSSAVRRDAKRSPSSRTLRQRVGRDDDVCPCELADRAARLRQRVGDRLDAWPPVLPASNASPPHGFSFAGAERCGRRTIHTRRAETRPVRGLDGRLARPSPLGEGNGPCRCRDCRDQRRLPLTHRLPSIYLGLSIRRSPEMLKLFTRTKGVAVSFCERCGQVCGSSCRADAIRERALRQTLAYGWRHV